VVAASTTATTTAHASSGTEDARRAAGAVGTQGRQIRLERDKPVREYRGVHPVEARLELVDREPPGGRVRGQPLGRRAALRVAHAKPRADRRPG
jgi:hypothetical protein